MMGILKQRKADQADHPRPAADRAQARRNSSCPALCRRFVLASPRREYLARCLSGERCRRGGAVKEPLPSIRARCSGSAALSSRTRSRCEAGQTVAAGGSIQNDAAVSCDYNGLDVLAGTRSDSWCLVDDSEELDASSVLMDQVASIAHLHDISRTRGLIFDCQCPGHGALPPLS
jgi:hypothetical protein